MKLIIRQPRFLLDGKRVWNLARGPLATDIIATCASFEEAVFCMDLYLTGVYVGAIRARHG